MISFRRNIRCSPDPSLHRQCSVLRDQAGSVLDHAGGEVRGVQGSGEGPLPRYWREGSRQVGEDRLCCLHHPHTLRRRLCIHRPHLPAPAIPVSCCRVQTLPLYLDGHRSRGSHPTDLDGNSQRLLAHCCWSPDNHNDRLSAHRRHLYYGWNQIAGQKVSLALSRWIFQRLKKRFFLLKIH